MYLKVYSDKAFSNNFSIVFKFIIKVFYYYFQEIIYSILIINKIIYNYNFYNI